ncbi:MAG: hypothetical protein GOVbin1709_74 [Prokaryotic dsDNA virus sp.]|nr:MAG: hypothetical protein GOVbin1709_74 [Prokaryotic dsDNA virus sp.]|tara:strand:+ start:19648 stop:21021 length:1374 start_codon:yes stop_codon:yes gene_type:complete
MSYTNNINNNNILNEWIDPDVDLSVQKHAIIKPNLENYIADMLCKQLRDTQYYRQFSEGIGLVNQESESDVIDQSYGKSAALDCFKLWFNEKRIVKVNPKMYWFHHFLSSLDNHLLRMVTQDRFGFSYIAAKVIIDTLGKYFYDNSSHDFKETMDNLNQLIKNGEDINQNDIGKGLNNAATRAMNKIRKSIRKADDMGIGKGNHPADLKMVDSLLDSGILNKVNITKRQINQFVKSIVTNATESIGGIAKTNEDSLFDADDIDDINNLENFLHEVLYPDLSVNEKKYYMGFDVYIDDSGSMCGRVNFNDGTESQSKTTTLRTLSRIFVYKMLKLGILKDVYLFSSTDQLVKLNEGEIFSKTFDGGTDIKQCIDKSKQQNRPSIIVTDGYDYFDPIEDYSDKVYFVVLDCGRLPECFEKYHDNNQILFWIDGKFEKSFKNKDGGYFEIVAKSVKDRYR